MGQEQIDRYMQMDREAKHASQKVLKNLERYMFNVMSEVSHSGHNFLTFDYR